MSILRLRECLAGLFVSLALASAHAAPARTALVIGNAHYESSTGALRNTTNDAKAVAQTLRALGFTVIERHDLTREQLLRAVDEFRKTVSGAEVAVFYYAGHGISVDGANYLIPIKSGFNPQNADGTTLRMLAETRLFNAEQAVADMNAAGAACNLVILDACRNTPLAHVERTRGLERSGLAEMTPPAGSLIAFAADAGQTAFDGDGSNGLYTEELVKQMRTPGLTIEQVFKRTRAGVVRRSDGAQMPAEYSRLVGDDIYLAGQPSPPVAQAVTPESPANPPDLVKLAKSGQAEQCLAALKVMADAQGPGSYATEPLEIVLEQIKIDLKGATAPSSRVVTAAALCGSIISIAPKCLPLSSPSTQITAKAYNRRGDALYLLNRASEALQCYNAAQALTPDDAYILYNRGRANLALGNKEAAKSDFTAAVHPRSPQPGAKKLAEAALVQLK